MFDEAQLRAIREAWPDFSVPDAQFRAHLAARPGATALPDLYLACACAGADPTALARFDREVLPRALAAAAQVDPSRAFADDVAQLVRQRLFVREPKKILEYGGKGPLWRWLKAVVVGTAVSLVRTRKSAAPAAALDALAAGADDPELQVIKSTHRGEFNAAFSEALAALDVRDRALLKLHFLQGLNVDELGATYRVHRATAARWLARARAQLLSDTRRRLGDRLSLGRAELDSLIQLLKSQLDVSLERALGTTP